MVKRKLAIQDMPSVRPVPIRTKDLNWWGRIKARFESRKWYFDKEWRFWFDYMGVEYEAVVPAGTIIDFASIPRVFWSLYSPTGILLIPSIIHDIGYREGFLYVERTICGDKLVGEIGDRDRMFDGKDRRWWDLLFLDIAYQVNGFKVSDKLAYWAVRIGGWGAWKF